LEHKLTLKTVLIKTVNWKTAFFLKEKGVLVKKPWVIFQGLHHFDTNLLFKLRYSKFFPFFVQI